MKATQLIAGTAIVAGLIFGGSAHALGLGGVGGNLGGALGGAASGGMAGINGAGGLSGAGGLNGAGGALNGNGTGAVNGAVNGNTVAASTSGFADGFWRYAHSRAVNGCDCGGDIDPRERGGFKRR